MGLAEASRRVYQSTLRARRIHYRQAREQGLRRPAIAVRRCPACPASAPPAVRQSVALALLLLESEWVKVRTPPAPRWFPSFPVQESALLTVLPGRALPQV